MVTVLMPVKDTPAGQLRQAVESILGQTLGDFEFLILNDGSQKPETIQELDRLAAADTRIRLHVGEGVGVTKTLNRGLELTTRGFIARQDADDWSDPRRLEMQCGFLRAHPDLGLCGSNAWTHRHDGRPLWPTRLPRERDEIRDAFWWRNPFVHGAAMFRTAAARALDGYREEFPCAQDYDFFWRLSDAYGAANLSEALYHYRYSSGSVSIQRASEQARAHRAAQILAQARQTELSSGLDPRDEISRALAAASRELEANRGSLRALLKQADHRMLAGDTWGACRAYLDLWKTHPGSRLAWGKLLRWALFSALPPTREICFR
jgi:glycosyl transferase family 2